MLRTLALGLIAAASLGVAALAPTGASAHERLQVVHASHHGAGFHRHAPAPRWHGARAHYRQKSCLQKRLVHTHGGWRTRVVNVCR